MTSRRLFLQSLAAASCASLFAKDGKPLAGVFPIVQTPFTNDDKLDTKTLGDEIRFLHRTGVQGVVWPQLASEYFDLTKEERFAGMEVVAGVGNSLKPAVVLGVQANDIAGALEYTKHAEKLAPDALIALPPRDWKDKSKISDYYKAISDNSARPLFVQAIGDMSVDFLYKMAERAPNLKYVKDEAGESLPRLSEFRRHGGDGIKGVFTGNHGKTFYDELARGSAGTMPAAPFGDLYAAVWDAWKAGNRKKSFDAFTKVSAMVSQAVAYGLPGMKYMLELRGVFPNHNCRSAGKKTNFDEEAKQTIKETMSFLKPFFKA
ncbi:MAG: dihydrodipicolinate synthase family protein [Candidatus Solibacter usitatus]|nr:dihydrodipicolinate synthase family protein [Candidatus Solibacter usitatus]